MSLPNLILGILLVSFTACSGSAKPSPKPAAPATTASPGATVEQAVALFVSMGRTIVAAGNDCDAMATNVRAWLAAHNVDRMRVNAALARAADKTAAQRYRARLSEQLELIMGMKAGLDECHAHAGVAAVWRELGR